MLWLFVNNVAISMGVQVHFKVMISFPSNILQNWDIYTDVEPYGRSILIFSIMDVPVYIHANSEQRPSFLHSLTNIGYLLSF